MRKTPPLLLLATVLLCTALPLDAQGFDPELYETFVTMRTGDGSSPVYWYSVGTVYSYPDGEPLMTLEGFDTARRVRGNSATENVQLSRKIFVYRDLETNEVLDTYRGNAVSHIEYPYQKIDYVLKGEQLRTFVEQGAGERIQKIGPGTNTQAKRLGDATFFHSPLFLDIQAGPRKIQAFENYDFLVQDHEATTGPNRYQLSWIRYGDRPPWAGVGKTIIHLISWRVDAFEDLPESMTSWIRENRRAWMQPPRDMDEIEALQRGEFDPNPSP